VDGIFRTGLNCHSKKVIFLKSKLLIQQKLLNIFQKLMWPNKVSKDNVKKIAIYRVGNIGDIVCSIPAMIAVRETYKDAHITLVTSPGKSGNLGAKEILQSVWFLDEIYEYYAEDISDFKGKWKIIKELKKKNFDLWVNLPLDRASLKRNFRDMAFVRLIGVKKAIGFEPGLPPSPLLKQCLKLPLPNEVERLLGILKKYQIKTSKVRFDLPITDKVVKKCNDIIEELNIPQDKPWVGLAPFTKQPAKQWPLERFLKVANYLKERGFILLILGGKNESKKGEEFAKKIGKSCFNLSGKLSIIESAYILMKCKFLVTNDSGPMHLAAAVGTKCVAIFSAHSYPGQWEPYGEGHIILRKDVECSPCYLMECPKGNLCINLIAVEEVINAVNKLAKEVPL